MKKLIALLAVPVFVFAACGNNTPATEEETNDEAGEVMAQNDEQPAAEVEETKPAVSKPATKPPVVKPENKPAEQSQVVAKETEKVSTEAVQNAEEKVVSSGKKKR
jgi:PBP1b-binding outer membrane lipoprotein LpoB